MNWNKLTTAAQIDEIKALSAQKPVFIFKHSTSCSISSMSLDRLQRNWKEEDADKITPYYLDLLAYRALSNQVATDFGVPHESPQLIVIHGGKAVYNESHYGISYASLMAQNG
jgi:bacillithiol system protein YtxJ